LNADRRAFKGPFLSEVVTPSEDDSQLQNKNASIELVQLIDEWADSFVKSRQLVLTIIEQAQKEDISSFQLRIMIEFALKKRGLKERQIRNLMPSELRDSSKIRVVDDFAALSAANDDNNSLEESYDDDEEPGEDLPLTETVDLGHLHQRVNIGEFLSKEADGETKFYFENISMTMAKTELLTRKGLQTFRRLYFEL
jgi:hypothetical protein